MPKALGEGARVSGPGAGGRRIKDGQGLPRPGKGRGGGVGTKSGVLQIGRAHV